DWDGNGTVDETVSGQSGKQVSHSYASSGTYTVLMYATDPSGVASAVVTKSVSVTAALLQTDPADPTKTVLVVGGTTATETITFTPADNLGNIKVTIGGVNQGTFHPTAAIIAFGYGGNDTVQAVTATIGGKTVYVTVPLVLVGGNGADTLLGGSGNDLLVGG